MATTPLSDRPFLIGDDELMQYLGISSKKTLTRQFLSKGLCPYIIGRQRYFYKKDIDAFIRKNNINPIK